ncbi:HAD family phosphatase [Pengzhenrongella sicca]|uniref:HAD family phosphatase n=1 Tax=Pengzhenrongella sicca TaxID=2819238 RepID=A0A8A4ZH30_9MICO|nr:HAD family phosphatase [Pengzhenrongella sicca]
MAIFDCDGVLVDSERLAVEIDARAIGALGWAITEAEVVERFLGRSDADVLAAIEHHLGHPVPADWERRWAGEYARTFDERLEAVPGVAAAIAALTAAGLRTCVASSGSLEKMRRTLGRVGLWDHFEGRIFSASEVDRGKPAPDLFLHAASRSGVPAGRCVVVEDSQYGVAGARAAGMRCVGFAGGITPAAQLREADVVITDMAALPAAVTALLA